MPDLFLWYSILIIGTAADQAFGIQQDPIRFATSASSTCFSQETIDVLLRNVTLTIKKYYDTITRSCGGPGWTRVAYLNMSDPQQTCPSNWTLNASPVRGCGRSSNSPRNCDSVIYPVSGLAYNRVCGRLLAYHKGFSEGFSTLFPSSSLETAYVSGISLTHGSPGTRQHIWTFVGAENEADIAPDNCPCANTNITWAFRTPSFIGSDYFCETGRRGRGISFSTIYINDPLWDGEGCGPTSSCCEFNSPPWFYKSLPQSTTDDLEIRLCAYYPKSNEDKLIVEMDIYVQ